MIREQGGLSPRGAQHHALLSPHESARRPEEQTGLTWAAGSFLGRSLVVLPPRARALVGRARSCLCL